MDHGRGKWGARALLLAALPGFSAATPQLAAQGLTEWVDAGLGGRTPTRAVAVGDLDGDGRAELLAGLATGRDGTRAGIRLLTVAVGGGVVERTPMAWRDQPGDTTALALVDVDGDGDLDVVEGRRDALLWWQNLGALRFASGGALAGGGVRALAVARFEPGAAPRLLVVDAVGDLAAHGMPGEGGVIAAPLPLAVGEQLRAVAAGDLDGDGRDDAYAVGDRGELALFTNPGAPPLVRRPTTLAARAVAVADLDGDGRADALVGGAGEDRIRLGGADRRFRWHRLIAATDDTFAVALVDVDGDGRRDALSGSAHGLVAHIWCGNGFWPTPPRRWLEQSDRPIAALAAGDCDDDGDADLFVGADGEPDRLLLAEHRELRIGTEARAGAWLRFDLDLAGGGLAWLLLGSGLRDAPLDYGPMGRLWIDPAGGLATQAIAVPAWGRYGHWLSLPRELPAGTWVAQVLSYGQDGRWRFGAPRRFDVAPALDANANGAELAARVHVENRADVAVRTVLTPTVPFAAGARHGVDDLSLGRRPTAWRVLQRWPDGSVRVAQAQAALSLAPGARFELPITAGQPPLTRAFAPHRWLQEAERDVVGRIEVTDGRGGRYAAQFRVGDGEILHETTLVRVQRIRLHHRPLRGTTPAPIERGFLTSTLYVTLRRDSPVFTVDWVVGNDYVGADDPRDRVDPDLRPLGGVDVTAVALRLDGASAAVAHRADWHAVTADVADGAPRFTAMRDTWIDDGQTRRYRLHGLVQPSWAPSADAKLWRDTLSAAASVPPLALATRATWGAARAFGVGGDLIAGPPDAVARAALDHQRWLARGDFGTWGTFGDVNKTGQAGTPRNAPVSAQAAHLLQSLHAPSFDVLEQMAWMQAHRPYHLYGLQVGARERLYLYFPTPARPTDADISDQSLGRRGLWRNDPWTALRTRVDHRAHGFQGYDVNHWTTDLLFDYWTLTGDDHAREELRQLGESLMGMLRLEHYPMARVQNARAEGWCTVGFVQAFLATGDERIAAYARERIADVVDRERWKGDVPTIREYRPDPRTGFGMDVTYYPPWEHGSVMLGFLAADRFLAAPQARAIAEDVVKLIDHSWVFDAVDPTSGATIPHAIRYWTPLRRGTTPLTADAFDATRGPYLPSKPLGSVNDMFVVGLAQLVDRSTDPAVVARARWQLAHLVPTLDADARWDRWRTALPPAVVAAIEAGTLAPPPASMSVGAAGDADAAPAAGPVILTQQPPVAMPPR